MLLTRRIYLIIGVFLLLLITFFELLIFVSCLLSSVILGIALYLDYKLPSIESDYEPFRTNRIETVQFIEINHQFRVYVEKIVNNKIRLYDKIEFKKQFTGKKAIDNQLNELLELINEDYVCAWFEDISPNLEFPQKLYFFINYVVSSLGKRLKEINVVNLLTNKFIDEVTKHNRLYRLTKNQLSYKIYTENEFVTKFFENERKLEKTFSREKLCTDFDSLLSFISSITDILQFLLIPYNSFRNETFKLLSKEIFIKLILMPMLETFSNPDFINSLIISLFKTYTPSTETLLYVLQVIENEDELKALLESVDNEILFVRSKDDEDDDMKMKNQLSSLLYLKRIIISHLKRLECNYKNIVLKENRFSNDALNKTKENAKNVSISFDTILHHNIALEYFIDYMACIKAENYINFYINVESFKISVEQGLFELYLCGISDNPNGNETQCEQLKHSIYEAAVNILETYLDDNAPSKLTLVDENYCKQLQELFKNSNDFNVWMNESLFDDVFVQVRDIILNHENFFPSFKQSKQFWKLCEAIDLIENKLDNINTNDKSIKSFDEISQSSGSIPDSQNDEMNNSVKFFVGDSDNYDSRHSESSGGNTEKKNGFKLDIVETGILNEFGKTYVAYLMSVEKKNGGKWISLRRYSEFYTFHQILLTKCGQFHFDLKSILILPPKTVLRNRLNQSFVQNRKYMLNLYLQKLNYLFEKFSFLREDIERFLSPGHYFDPYHEEEDNDHDGVCKVEANNNNMTTSILNPIRTISNVVKNGSENLMDGFQKLSRTLSLQPNDQSKHSQGNDKRLPSLSYSINSNYHSVNNSNKLLNNLINETELEQLDINSNSEEENIPLLTLLDEVFDLKIQNFWFRRRIIELFRQIIQVTYSETINRKIVDYIDKWTSPQAIKDYIKMFQNSYWQNGLMIETVSVRQEDIYRRKVAAKVILLTLFSDLKKVIGSETLQNGSLNLIELFQNKTLNLRLVLLLFEIILKEIFPSNYFEQIFIHLYAEFDQAQSKDRTTSATATSATATSATTELNNNQWPPYLSTFISGI